MTLSTVLSRAQRGIDAPLVRVETHISNGIPAFNIVGLPATAVRESKDRVRSALINSHFDWPDKRLTVNLSPADLPKDSGRFDLPIALSILAASGQVPEPALKGMEFIGELALSGALRPISGAVGAAIAASRCQHSLVHHPRGGDWNHNWMVRTRGCASDLARPRCCDRQRPTGEMCR